MKPEDILLTLKAAQRDSMPVFTDGLKEYGLDGVDCPLCGNTGTQIYEKNGFSYARECSCMKRRRSERDLKKSGMQDLLAAYSFENYERTDAQTEEAARRAYEFAERGTGWFFISGQPGSGKTHICTAICGALADAGRETKYMLWRDDVMQIKSALNTEEYVARMNRLKKADALYIDDFFKGNVTPADVNLAFELLNARYIGRKLTVISSELSLGKILEIDEAVGSRIAERAKDFIVRAPQENRRLK